MTDIAIYVEGGGNTAQQKADLRTGFESLLRHAKEKARLRKMNVRVICCGGRQTAYEDFINAVKSNPERINVLLVDSEGPVSTKTSPMEYLKQREPWERLSSVSPDRIHLMIQCMEAWIVADRDALKKYYDQHFQEKVLPARNNLEQEPKADIYSKLAKATARTSKGEYGKIKHARHLLQKIDPEKVAQRCPSFLRLTCWLEETIDSASTKSPL